MHLVTLNAQEVWDFKIFILDFNRNACLEAADVKMDFRRFLIYSHCPDFNKEDLTKLAEHAGEVGRVCGRKWGWKSERKGGGQGV